MHQVVHIISNLYAPPGAYKFFHNITVLRTLYKKTKSSDKNNSVRQTLNIRLFHNKNNDL